MSRTNKNQSVNVPEVTKVVIGGIKKAQSL